MPVRKRSFYIRPVRFIHRWITTGAVNPSAGERAIGGGTRRKTKERQGEEGEQEEEEGMREERREGDS